MSEPALHPELSPGQPPPPGRLDLNLLPARHRPRPISVPGVLAGLLLISLVAMLLPAWQWFDQQAREYQAAVAEVEQLTLALQTGVQEDDLNAMATQVAEIDAQAAGIESAMSGLGLRDFLWGQVMPRVLSQTPVGITYEEIQDEGERVVLEGTSTDELLPLTLVENLTALGIFDGVRLESLDRLDVVEVTPTPSATPRARTTPTPTVAAGLPELPRFHFVVSLILEEGDPQ